MGDISPTLRIKVGFRGLGFGSLGGSCSWLQDLEFRDLRLPFEGFGGFGGRVYGFGTLGFWFRGLG